MKHDDDCPGCNPYGVVRDYLTYCDSCGASIQGDTQHHIGQGVFCDSCAKDHELDCGQSGEEDRD